MSKWQENKARTSHKTVLLLNKCVIVDIVYQMYTVGNTYNITTTLSSFYLWTRIRSHIFEAEENC